MAEETLLGQEAAINQEGGEADAKAAADAAAKAAADEAAKGGEGKPDDKPADDKAGDGKADDKPVAKAPEKYDLKPPEGQEFGSEFLTAYEGVARKLDLSNEQAQELYSTLAPVLEKQQLAQIEAVKSEWLESSKSDKEFGGDKLQESLGVANAALKEYGSPELKDFLKATGLGSHPEVIRLFHKVGKTLTPDKFVGGDAGNAGDGKPKTFNDLAAKLYT
jgi:hypothetical protein